MVERVLLSIVSSEWSCFISHRGVRFAQVRFKHEVGDKDETIIEEISPPLLELCGLMHDHYERG